MLKLRSEDGRAEQGSGVSGAWPANIKSSNHRKQSLTPPRGDVYNLDLSKRRVAAVKQASVDRNDALEGRARSRCVELSRDGKVWISKTEGLVLQQKRRWDMSATGKGEQIIVFDYTKKIEGISDD